MNGNRLACPRCLKADYIGENVTGWREIKGAYLVAGKLEVDRDYRSRVEDPEHHSFFCSGPGCNVEEEIPLSRMAQLDRDGKPIPIPLKGQGTLDLGGVR